MQYSSNSENYSSLSKSPSWKEKDGKGGYVYKKSSYQYSTSGDHNSSLPNRNLQGNNIDQLDALLEDLKTERKNTLDRDILHSSNYKTIDRGVSPGRSVSSTKKIITTTSSSKYNDNHNLGTLDSSSSPLYNGGGGTLSKSSVHYETKTLPDRSYDSNYNNISTNIYGTTSKSTGLSRYSEEKDYLVAPAATSTTIQTLENDLQNIPLSDNILPVPGTKVTTTVRTYTYEVPADSLGSRVLNQTSYNTLQKHDNQTVYNTLQKHDTSNTVSYSSPPPHVVPKSPNTVVYNTETISTLDKHSERPVISNQVYELREHHETNTVNNTYPASSPLHGHPEPLTGHPGPLSGHPGPGPNKTVVYKVSSTTNGGVLPPFDQERPLPPAGTSSRYYYTESTTNTNTIHGPPGHPGHPGHPGPMPTETVYLPQSPKVVQHKILPNGYNPPHQPHDGGHVPPPTTTTYKYSSTSTHNTTNTHPRGGPDYGSPQHPNEPYHLAPFPVDGLTPNGSNPPQRVDDLMQSFGTTVVDSSNLDTPRKREVETSVANPSTPHIPSVNKAGKEVYYPPGHDVMLTKREEMMASGSAGGGRWAKGSGMYEYESGYKSKSKTKTGGAMVPVCLPLCCAMPCSIM